MTRGLRIGLCSLLVALAAPPVAGAANITVTGGNRIAYDALAGETNNLQVSRLGVNYMFVEVGGVPVTPAGACAPAGANASTCPVAGIRDIDISLDNMGDTLSVAATVIDPQLEDLSIFGQDGNDNLIGAPNIRNNMQGGNGTDTVTGGSLADDISGNADPDTMSGGEGDDLLRVDDVGVVPDSASGGPGDDQLAASNEGPDGADTYAGGPGIDSIDIRGRRDDLNVTLNGVADDGGTCPGVGCEGDNIGADIEFIDSGEGNDTIVGTSGLQRLDAGPGNDNVSGAGGDDEVVGSEGDDQVQGGAGNDFLIGADGADQMLGGKGDDYFLLFDLFDGDRDVFDGGPGFDETGGGGGESAFALRIDLDGRADDGPRGSVFDGLRDNVRGTVEGLEGTIRADILIGNGRPNELEGGDGADRLVAKGGADGIDGGRGNDNISAGKGRDSVIAGGGADRIKSRDKSPDEVSCGSSKDLVIADRRDRPGADCDRVRR